LIAIRPEEAKITAVRAQGAGGQNVNKVSNAVHLRFDIGASSLTDAVKERLLGRRDARITALGVVIIKAQRYRSLERNREDALARLQHLVDSAASVRPLRRPTRPTRGSERRRIEDKIKRGKTKAARRRPGVE
jgi:ribosome-associated protein